jgi:hypothetical protein
MCHPTLKYIDAYVLPYSSKIQNDIEILKHVFYFTPMQYWGTRFIFLPWNHEEPVLSCLRNII